MSETMHKADWRARVCRGAGVLVLLAGVLFAAGLCVADTPHDSSVSDSMHSTLSDPAFWSRFQFRLHTCLSLPLPATHDGIEVQGVQKLQSFRKRQQNALTQARSGSGDQ